MDIITKDTIQDLIENCHGKAVTIYMPTVQTTREIKQNPIRLKNLIADVKNKLNEEEMSNREIESYLAPLSDLIPDEAFWQSQNEGLALFLDKNELRLFHLPERVDEIAIVSNTFHITPLIPICQGEGNYYLLSIAQERPKFYQGSKYELVQIEELNLPESLQKMFDEFFEFHSHLQFHNRSITPNQQMPMDRQSMFFGQGGGDDIDRKAEILNFFHRFDKALMTYLGGSNAPLVMAGLGYLHPLYKQANSYPNLIDEGITKDISQLPEDDIHQLSWALVKNQYQTDVKQALEDYSRLKNKNDETSENLETIVSAAWFKRVHTMFVAKNSFVWGNFSPDDNTVTIDDKHTSSNQDLLDLAAAQTIINGGTVLLISQDKIPRNATAAAILRY